MKPILKAIAEVVVALVVLAFGLNHLVRVSYSPTRSIGIVEEWLFGRPIVQALAPHAWDRARWGMSTSEIQRAYPAAKPQKREIYEHGSYCDLTLTGTSIAGYDFAVEFPDGQLRQANCCAPIQRLRPRCGKWRDCIRHGQGRARPEIRQTYHREAVRAA